MFNVGDIVKCQRAAPAVGTWPRYAGRKGRVVVPDNYGEVGITWALNETARNDAVDSWFLPTELVLSS